MASSFPGGRSFVTQAFKLQSMEDKTIDVMMASISESSHKQYETVYRKWWSFAQDHNLSFFSPTISEILQFLTKQFELEASGGSINSCRSAMAFFMGPELGQHPLIKRFCKGASNMRPAEPRYKSTWDPKIVLDFMSDWVPNDQIPLDQLSAKLAVLLALTTGQRMQTLIAIDIRNIVRVSDCIEIKIPAKLKTSKTKKKQPTLNIPTYKTDPRICVTSALEAYLQRTKEIRGEEQALFISFRRPYKAITTQTLSRWIKNVLTESGIDTSVFSAYSTRHASTSRAKRMGVNMDVILKTAGWSDKTDTFARFYDRDLIMDRNSFAVAVLNS